VYDQSGKRVEGAQVEAIPDRSGGLTGRVTVKGQVMKNVRVEARATEEARTALATGRMHLFRGTNGDEPSETPAPAPAGTSRLEAYARRGAQAGGRSTVPFRVSDETVANTDSGPFQVFRSPNMRLLNGIVSGDAYLARELASTRSEPALVASGGTNLLRGLERRVWVPFVANPALRRLTVEALLEDMNARSDRIKEAIRALPAGESGELALDTIFVGAGKHTADTVAATTKADPTHSYLVVESSNVVSANFARVGDHITMNSPNRAETGVPPTPGQGNRNPTQGPAGIPDMSGSFYPEVGAFADDATLALATARPHPTTQLQGVLMRTSVQRVTKDGDQYRVEMKDLDSGRVFGLRARNVVIGTGLGKARIPVADPASRTLFEEESGRVDYTKPQSVPGILTTEDALRLGKLARAGRDPYRRTEDGRVPRMAVIGGGAKGGDSGKTFIEWLEGLSKPSAYNGARKQDNAQRGEVGPVDWVVGANEFKSCKEFLDNARSRYAQLSGPLNGGKVKPVNARLVKIEEIGDSSSSRRLGRYKLTFQNEQTNEQTTEWYDQVVSAAGYENDVGALVKDVARAPTTPPQSASAGLPVRYEGVIGSGVVAVYGWEFALNGRKQTKTYTQEQFGRLEPLKDLVRGVGEPFDVQRIESIAYQVDMNALPLSQIPRLIAEVRAEASAGSASLEDDPNRAVPVQARVPGFDGPQNVVKAVVGPSGQREGVYLIGPASGSKRGTSLVTAGETVGVGKAVIAENFASIFALEPRSAAFGREILAGAHNPAGRGAAIDLKAIENPPRTPLGISPGAASVKAAVSAEALAKARQIPYEATNVDRELLQFRVARALDRFTFPGLERGRIGVRVERDASTKAQTVVVTGENGLSDAATQQITQEIGKNPALVRMLLETFGGRRARDVAFEWQVRTSSAPDNGTLLPGSLRQL
jgi:hypothetical protein